MSDGSAVHRYAAVCTWEGSTGVGYEAYDRGHHVHALPSPDELRLTSDPAFGGDPALLNPEQLLLAAASSCQLLSFLAVAARARVDVVAYRDEASAEMPEPTTGGFTPMWIERIVLRPMITVRGTTSDDRLRRLVDLAHRECFIANSLRSEMSIEPVILRAA